MRYVIEKYAGSYSWERIEECGILERAIERMHSLSLELDRKCRVIEVFDETESTRYDEKTNQYMMPANIEKRDREHAEKLEREGWQTMKS